MRSGWPAALVSAFDASPRFFVRLPIDPSRYPYAFRWLSGYNLWLSHVILSGGIEVVRIFQSSSLTQRSSGFSCAFRRYSVLENSPDTVHMVCMILGFTYAMAVYLVGAGLGIVHLVGHIAGDFRKSAKAGSVFTNGRGPGIMNWINVDCDYTGDDRAATLRIREGFRGTEGVTPTAVYQWVAHTFTWPRYWQSPE